MSRELPTTSTCQHLTASAATSLSLYPGHIRQTKVFLGPNLTKSTLGLGCVQRACALRERGAKLCAPAQER